MTSINESFILASVIIPAYNVESWIAKCIESVLDQSYRNLEVIIINDGSTDATAEIVERFSISDPRIRTVEQQNQGLSAVRNRGIRLAQGEILFFLDSDDWIHEDTVSDVVKLFQENEIDVVMYQCAKYYNDSATWSGGSDEYYWRSFSKLDSMTCKTRDVPEILALYPLAQLKVISKDFIRNNKLFFIEGLKYEDNPFHVAIFGLNPNIGLLRRKYYAWRQDRPGQITAKPHTSDCLVAMDEMLRLGEKFDSGAYLYLIIAITRLISSVAKNITSNEDRRHFLMKSVQKLRDGIDDEVLEGAIYSMLNAKIIHPGDFILVRGLLFSPNNLAAVLGFGLIRYWGGLVTVLIATRTGKFSQNIKLLFSLFRNYQLLVNYSRGTGESKVKGLG
jgi:glycosyltransferase involved in cell wall biosynthesis